MARPPSWAAGSPRFLRCGRRSNAALACACAGRPSSPLPAGRASPPPSSPVRFGFASRPLFGAMPSWGGGRRGSFARFGFASRRSGGCSALAAAGALDGEGGPLPFGDPGSLALRRELARLGGDKSPASTCPNPRAGVASVLILMHSGERERSQGRRAAAFILTLDIATRITLCGGAAKGRSPVCGSCPSARGSRQRPPEGSTAAAVEIFLFT